MFKKFLSVALSVTLFGIVNLSTQSADAKRIYDKDNETKVITERESVGEKKTFRERIDAILAEMEASEQKREYDLLPGTPVITSVYDERIAGTAMATEEQCVDFLLKNNPFPNISCTPQELVSYYYEEGSKEGVRPDVAFCQALHETGFFRYGGTVTPDQNNYCGLGTTSSTVKGHYFPSARIGVRAHIQHILAYTTDRLPREELVDPRYYVAKNAYGSLGISTWNGFNGRWAVPGIGYGEKILKVFRQIIGE